MRDLSGGEQRVIEIYACLKTEANLLLLDEPFSHLSPVYIEKIKALLLTEKLNKAIIISDHMYRHILEMSDELYLLKNGSTQLIKNKKALEDYAYLQEGTFSNE
ncbi:ABC transporter [Salegentibacter echinorum]|uniref:ABC transporter n=1 Tax=Salegentibacter echinorum TaxID=1073325 RepID=A0A1M5BZK4_SALEC|nr:ABC transporter [Salegentibacter echinorum]